MNILDYYRGHLSAWEDAEQEIDERIENAIEGETVLLQEIKDRITFNIELWQQNTDQKRDFEVKRHNPDRGRTMREKGPMIGCEEAIDFVRRQQESEKQIRCLRRMQYEFEKEVPRPPKYRKGIYGRKYDTWSCGNCGKGAIHEVWYKYCPNCGYAIDWTNRIEEQEDPELAQEGELNHTDGAGTPEIAAAAEHREIQENDGENIDDYAAGDQGVDEKDRNIGAIEGEDYVQRTIFDSY